MTDNKVESSTKMEAESQHYYIDEEKLDYFKYLIALGEQKLTIIFVTSLAILLGLYVCFTTPVSYISKTTITTSQVNLNLGLNALTTLGGLGGLGGLAGIPGLANLGAGKSNDGMLINYMRSRKLQSAMVDSLKLVERYGVKNINEAINELNSNIDINVDKKTGLIIITAENKNPELAAILANEMVNVLKNYLIQLDLERVAEKRYFFEKQIISIRQKMPQLEIDYKNSERLAGISAATYFSSQGNLPNQITNKEAQIRMLMKFVTVDNPDIKRLNTELLSLKEQLKNYQLSNKMLNKSNENKLSSENSKDLNLSNNSNGELILQTLQLYNSFKIKEAVLQGLNQQLELNNTESIQQALPQIQIIDKAEVPIFKAKPDKAKIMTIFTSVGFLISLLIALIKQKFLIFRSQHESAEKLRKLARAWHF